MDKLKGVWGIEEKSGGVKRTQDELKGVKRIDENS